MKTMETVKNNEGWTVLTKASFEGHLDIVKYLHQAGADINIMTQNGDTALMLAAYCRGSFLTSKENEDIVKYLHQAGADINITNNDGNSSDVG